MRVACGAAPREALRQAARMIEEVQAAPQARASSSTRRNADIAARGSRPARRPVSMSAAGIVAASMARRCHITI